MRWYTYAYLREGRLTFQCFHLVCVVSWVALYCGYIFAAVCYVFVSCSTGDTVTREDLKEANPNKQVPAMNDNGFCLAERLINWF